MFFNPLFIDTTSAGAIQSQKTNVLGKSQYLFSDIIKISLSQNQQSEGESTPMFNLSLVDNLNSISSLFSAINANAVKSASGSKEAPQDADMMLVNFLQFAFINQGNPEEGAGKVQELMQDKELLLSKESLTKALSQLLQMYQPASKNGAPSSIQMPNPETMADNILKTIDEKGKAVLNFNNSNSQIKIELTKLNTEEKELFISTKIIPLINTVTKPVSGKELSKTEVEDKTQSGEPAESSMPVNGADDKKSTINPEVYQAGGTEMPKIENTNGNIKISDSEYKIAKAAAQNVPVQTPAEKKEVKEENGKNSNISPDLKKTETVTENLNLEQVKTEKADVKKEVQPTAGQTKNDEYKMKVVEVNTGSETSSAKAENDKNYELTPFEKNVLKKTQITFTSADAQSKKEVIESPEAKTAAAANKNIDTVVQAEKEILKTNNMLFDEKAVPAEGEAEVPVKSGINKKEAPAETQPQPDGKTVKSSSKNLKPDAKEIIIQQAPESETKNGKNTIAGETEPVKGVKTAKTVNRNGEAETQLKSSDIKQGTEELKQENGKKIGVENEAGNQGKDTAGNQTQQGAGDRKGNDQKQFTMPNIAEKEHVLMKDDNILREQAKQSDVTKTVKTYEIIKEIKSFIEQGNRSSMTLKILPENLGSVKVSLDMVKNMVQARIDVDSENVKQFVQTNLDSLKHSLAQSGVNVSTLQVNVSSSDQKQPRFASPSKRKGGFGKALDFEEESSEAAKKIMGYNSYDYIA